MTVVEAWRPEMSDLQLALAAAGAVIIAGVVLFNAVQERSARRKAERDFGEPPPDALLDTAPARREPTLGDLEPATE